DRPARLARAQAVPQVLLRRHHQARRPVVVKRAPPHEIGPVLLELDPSRLDQAHERHLALEPLDLRARDSRHPFLLPKSVKPEGGFYLPLDGVLRYIRFTYTEQAKKGATTKTALHFLARCRRRSKPHRSSGDDSSSSAGRAGSPRCSSPSSSARASAPSPATRPSRSSRPPRSSSSSPERSMSRPTSSSG